MRGLLQIHPTGGALQILAPKAFRKLRVSSQVIADVDPAIEPGKFNKADLADKIRFQEFLEKHARIRQYSFQLRKCSDASCCRPVRGEKLPEWLPDPVLGEKDKDGNRHFKSFESVYGTETTDKDCPTNSIETATQVAEALQVIIMKGTRGYEFLRQINFICLEICTDCLL